MAGFLGRYRDKTMDRQELNWLMKNEERLANNSKKVLGLTAALSNFDVEMKYISGRLLESVSKMEEAGESNLSIVEEITATMNQVSDIISYTVETFQELAHSSEELSRQNTESSVLLKDVAALKEDVVADTYEVSSKMEQLAELTKEIGNIVGSVQSIATQTNLLALNASIEAARAGEAGKGFAVVAKEIGKLSDDTRTNLEGMTRFVDRIFEATDAGKNSVENALLSTNKMGEMIDTVSQTMGDNISQLDEVASGIKELAARMDEIKASAHEVNTAMEASAQDTQGLIEVTKGLYEDANSTVKLGDAISKIDDGLSDSIEDMYRGLLKGMHAISNEELLEVLRKAVKSHTDWAANLKGMINNMEVLPLQTNPNKCAFGHYYNALRIDNVMIRDEWSSIRSLHQQFHATGDKIIESIKRDDRAAALKMFEETEAVSARLLGILSAIENKVNQCNSSGSMVFA